MKIIMPLFKFKKLFGISIIMFCYVSLSAQQWKLMGDSTVSDYDGLESYITVDNYGIPYAVYIYTGATVKKFNGNQWVVVGTENFTGPIGNGNIFIAFDNLNIAYISYTDDNNNFKATVMKFDGTSWVPVGVKGFTPDHATCISLAIDKNGTPFVAFCDRDSTVIGGSYASVMRFDGNNWVYVGSRRFSQGSIFYTSLALDNNGMPYVAFWDMADIQHQPPYKATVMKFDGTNWVNVGSPGFAAWNSNNHALAFDSNNNLYFACAVGGNTTVMKFTGSNWTMVGSPGNISQGATDYNFILIDRNDVPYLAYSDVQNSSQATVKKFDGSNWTNAGNPDFSPGICGWLTLALGSNGNAYVSFKDGGTAHHSGGSTYTAVVAMMLENTTLGVNETSSNSSFTVYPSPSNGIFQITYFTDNKNKMLFLLTIKNELGQTIYSDAKANISGEYTKSIDLSQQPKGVYFVEMIVGDERKTKKIVLE